MTGEAALAAKGLSKSFRRRQVVRDVSFTVAAGDSAEIVGLLGPNGAGKSTSFHLVAGLLRPDAGTVELDGKDLGRLPLYRRAQLGLGYLPQEPTIFRGLSVMDNFIALLELRGFGRAERRARAERLIEEFHLEAVRSNRGEQLSGGERRRVEMAQVLIGEPRVVLLDEPFAGIDPLTVTEIMESIRGLRRRGIGVLLTDHNVRETLRICDRAYLIADGIILVSGPPEQIIADKRARENYLGSDFTI